MKPASGHKTTFLSRIFFYFCFLFSYFNIHSHTLLENLTDDAIAYCLAVFDEIFDHFPLFDETLRHIELCNNVISQIQRIRQNLSNHVYSY